MVVAPPHFNHLILKMKFMTFSLNTKCPLLPVIKVTDLVFIFIQHFINKP